MLPYVILGFVILLIALYVLSFVLVARKKAPEPEVVQKPTLVGSSWSEMPASLSIRNYDQPPGSVPDASGHSGE